MSTSILLDIDVMQEAGSWPKEAGDQARRAAALAYAMAGAEEEAELCIVLANDAFVRDLNKTYRGKDAPTNVLSFPARSIPYAAGPEPMGFRLLGDIVLARETLEREASEQGKQIEHHVAHLVVHGLLHLLGQDHEDMHEAETMEELERQILKALGIADPYAQGASHGTRTA